MKPDLNTRFLIVGPCAMESELQMKTAIQTAIEIGTPWVRAQVYKPRTNPNSFQGMEDKGIEILLKLQNQFSSMKFVCEVCSPEQMDKVSDVASMIQIGARNMQNFELLKYVGKNFKQEFVLLKRGFANTLEEWLAAAEYLIRAGVKKEQIILCERGSRSFTSPTGVSLDFIMALKAKSFGFRVIIDPSHGTRESQFVLPLATAALSMNFDGVMIECHPNPADSVSDARQALSLNEVRDFLIGYNTGSNDSSFLHSSLRVNGSHPHH